MEVKTKLLIFLFIISVIFTPMTEATQEGGSSAVGAASTEASTSTSRQQQEAIFNKAEEYCREFFNKHPVDSPSVQATTRLDSEKHRLFRDCRTLVYEVFNTPNFHYAELTTDIMKAYIEGCDKVNINLYSDTIRLIAKFHGLDWSMDVFTRSVLDRLAGSTDFVYSKFNFKLSVYNNYDKPGFRIHGCYDYYDNTQNPNDKTTVAFDLFFSSLASMSNSESVPDDQKCDCKMAKELYKFNVKWIRETDTEVQEGKYLSQLIKVVCVEKPGIWKHYHVSKMSDSAPKVTSANADVFYKDAVTFFESGTNFPTFGWMETTWTIYSPDPTLKNNWYYYYLLKEIQKGTAEYGQEEEVTTPFEIDTAKLTFVSQSVKYGLGPDQYAKVKKIEVVNPDYNNPECKTHILHAVYQEPEGEIATNDGFRSQVSNYRFWNYNIQMDGFPTALVHVVLDVVADNNRREPDSQQQMTYRVTCNTFAQKFLRVVVQEFWNLEKATLNSNTYTGIIRGWASIKTADETERDEHIKRFPDCLKLMLKLLKIYKPMVDSTQDQKLFMIVYSSEQFFSGISLVATVADCPPLPVEDIASANALLDTEFMQKAFDLASTTSDYDSDDGSASPTE